MLFKFWFICALLELFYVATAAYIIHENLTNGTLNDQSLYVERRSERKDSRAAEDAMGDSHGGEAFTEESAVTTPEHRRIKDIYMSCDRRIDGIAFSYHDAVGGSDWPIGRPTWYGTNHGGSTERKWTLEAGEYITSIRAGLCTPAGKTERVCHLSFWTNRRQNKGVEGLKPIECGISTGLVYVSSASVKYPDDPTRPPDPAAVLFIQGRSGDALDQIQGVFLDPYYY